MRARAFTIIELIVTISIIALMVSAAAIAAATVRRNGRDAQRISDLNLISSVINQSVLVNHGQYPVNPSSPSSSYVMCADQLQDSANTNHFDLSQFKGRNIPKDPLPETAGGCTLGNNSTFQSGYIYENRVSSTSPIVAQRSTDRNYEYALHTGLENPLFHDEQSLQLAGTTPIPYPAPARIEYVLYGKYCGVGERSDNQNSCTISY